MEPNRISLSMRLSPFSQRTTASVTNISLGHATILRAVGLASSLIPQPSNAAGPASSSCARTATNAEPNAIPMMGAGQNTRNAAGVAADEAPLPFDVAAEPVVHVAVELRDCRLVVKYQEPPTWAGISVPGHLQDFFSLHEEMFSLELPHVSLALPFLLPTTDEQIMGAETGNSNNDVPSTVVAIVGASIIMATTGYLGQPALPVLQLPKLTIERRPVTSGHAVVSGSDAQVQQLQLVCSSLDIGVHPSHLIVGTLAVQLCQQQLIGYLGGGNSDTSSGKKKCCRFQIFLLGPVLLFLSNNKR